MDPVSQAALGAAVAGTCCYRQLGPRALLWGAVAGAAPDIDVISALWADEFRQLELHRGITHSLFFAPIVGPICGYVLARYYEQRDQPSNRQLRWAWMLAIALALWSHPLLDVLTPYGTQLLLPFTDARFAINAMPIIDPIYTGILLLGLLAARFFRQRSRIDDVPPIPASRPHVAITAAFVISCSYLGYAWLQNEVAQARAEQSLAQLNIGPTTHLDAFPSILQVHHRRLVARDDDEVFIAYTSTWRDCSLSWLRYPVTSDPAYAALRATRGGRIFEWFSMGWSHAQTVQTPDGPIVQLSDLRYGIDTNIARSVFNLGVKVTAHNPTPYLFSHRPAPDGATFAQLWRDAYPDACERPQDALNAPTS